MRRLTFFLAAVLLVLIAQEAPCRELTFSIDPHDRNALRYSDMRVEEPDPLSITTGRFLSVDPVLDIKRSMREPQSWNRYSYVVNNPIRRIDPDGRVDGNSDDFARQLYPDDRAAQRAFDQDVGVKTATAAAVFGSLFIPGPEDLLMGTAAAALGRRLVARFAARFGAAVDACTCPTVFRGGESMMAAAKDVKIVDGLVQPTRGVSLNAVAQDVAKFGGAYRVTSVPDGLQIIQRGKNANHYEIVPKKAMTMDDYQKLLSRVKLERVQ